MKLGEIRIFLSFFFHVDELLTWHLFSIYVEINVGKKDLLTNHKNNCKQKLNE